MCFKAFSLYKGFIEPFSSFLINCTIVLIMVDGHMRDFDPYELMIIPPNKKAQMIMQEIEKSEPNLNLISDLITLGAYLDWQDESHFNWSLLHWAARYDRLEIARMLMGADVNMQDIWNRTPLHVAAHFGRVEIAQMLIDAGADVNVQTNGRRAPLHYATRFGKVEIVRMFIGAGAIKDIQNEDGQIPYDLAQTEELKTILRIM